MPDFVYLNGVARGFPQQSKASEQQRVALPRALARESRLTLLDERSSGFDEAFRDDLNQHGAELLRSTHTGRLMRHTIDAKLWPSAIVSR